MRSIPGIETLALVTDETGARFQAYLVERHDGEVYGESIFATMAESAEDTVLRYKIRALEAKGVRVEESAERWKQGDALGRTLARVPWDLFMKGFRPELARFVTEFEQAEATACRPIARWPDERVTRPIPCSRSS